MRTKHLFRLGKIVLLGFAIAAFLASNLWGPYAQSVRGLAYSNVGLIQNFTSENGGSFQIGNLTCTNHNDPDQENLTLIDAFTLRYQIWSDTYWPSDADVGWNRADSPCFTPQYAAGEDVISDFNFMIEPGPINTAKNGMLIIQWHYARNTDPPPVTLALGGNGYAQEKLGVEVRYGSNQTWVKAWTDDTLVQRGHWYHARMETNFQDYLRVYIDGEKVVDRNAPVGDGSNVWFTVGPLRSPAPETIAVNYRNIVVGNAD